MQQHTARTPSQTAAVPSAKWLSNAHLALFCDSKLRWTISTLNAVTSQNSKVAHRAYNINFNNIGGFSQ